MDLKGWEATINQIVDEARQELRESGKQKILLAWRAKLEKGPTLLHPFQIDEIVRAVRRRLSNASR